MKLFDRKSIGFKIIVAIVFVTLFNFISPWMPRVMAEDVSFGGILFEPIKDLLLVIADGIISVSQQFIFGIDVSFLTIYNPASGWKTAAKWIGAAVGVAAAILIPGAGLIATAILAGTGAYIGSIATSAIPGNFKLPMFLLTPEAIFSNAIPFLDINFFEDKEDKGTIEAIDANGDDIDGDGKGDKYYVEYDGNKYPVKDKGDYILTKTPTGQVVWQRSSALILKPTISKWYYALRNLAIVALLLILVYTAIRIIISSSAEDKAKYKQRLVDWLVAMCLLFFMHYIMAFAVSITSEITKAIDSANKPYYIKIGDAQDPKLKDYRYGNGSEDNEGEKVFGTGTLANQFRNDEIIYKDPKTGVETMYWPTTLMGKARIELQLADEENLTADDIAMRQFGYTVIYLALVIYTMLFLFRYLKRLLMLVFLTMIAPLMAMTYPLDKMRDGSAQGFNMWFKEYLYNLLIQPVHLILYTVLIGSAMDLVMDNLLYALVALGFILQAEKLLRKFFGFDKASTIEGSSALGGALAMQGLNMVNKALGRGEKSKGGNKGGNGAEKKKLADTRKRNKGKDTESLMDSAFGEEKGEALEAKNTERGETLETKDTERNDTTNPNPDLRFANEGALVQGAPKAPEPKMPQEDTRGLGQYMLDKYKGTDGYKRRQANKAGKLAARAINQGIRDDKHQEKKRERARFYASHPKLNATKNTMANVGRGIKKHAKQLGRGVRYIAPKAGKFAARTLAETAIKGGLAATGAMVGMTAGLVSDDFSNVAKWGLAGAGGGWAAGTGGLSGLGKGESSLGDKIYEVTHTPDEIKERMNAKADAAWMKDKETVKKYASKFGVTEKVAKEKYMKEAKKFRESGVTDDDVIIDSMNAKGFGNDLASPQKILLAKMSSQVSKVDDVDKLEARLQKDPRVTKGVAEKYANEVKRQHNWI